MKTKEEILSARIGTYGFTKLELSKPIICPIEALDAMQEYSDQTTKPLIEKISSLEASLLDVTRKSCARVDELKDEIADLKSQLLISEQKVKLNYNCAIESSKSEANEAVALDRLVGWFRKRVEIKEHEVDYLKFVMKEYNSLNK